jgi:hypothetical protein
MLCDDVLSFVIQHDAMLTSVSIVALNVVMLSAPILNVIMLRAVFAQIHLPIIIPSVIMPIVITINVVALDQKNYNKLECLSPVGLSILV